MSESSSAAVHAFDCPLCGGAFEVDAEWLGKTIPCPHCGDDVQLPEAPAVAAPDDTAPSVEAAPTPPTEAAAEPASVEPTPRKLTPEERAALRRRVNLSLAVAGALLLTVLFVVLAQLG